MSTELFCLFIGFTSSSSVCASEITNTIKQNLALLLGGP